VAAVATPAIEIEVDGRDVRVTNPDKIYFPAVGVTKQELVEHYIGVGPGILRALSNRPTYMERFPDGIDGEQVYQKRFPKYAPDWIQTVQITFPSGRSADALSVTSAADVAWAANLGTVTFHPWHARASDVDHPDELRIDLDPQPGTGFDEARRVALDVVRPLLADLGYVGFPKTSGGRGVHVYVRIEPRWRFVEVRRAAIAFAREVERRAPTLVTTAWWKEQRGVFFICTPRGLLPANCQFSRCTAPLPQLRHGQVKIVAQGPDPCCPPPRRQVHTHRTGPNKCRSHPL
jgi:DNA ligase D-like protein (predicted polymerase)